MTRLAIFASGEGSNAENIVEYFSDSQGVEVVILVSDNPSAGVHERMKRLGIPSVVFSKDEFAAEEPVLKKLATYQIDWIILSGFLKKVSGKLLAAYPNHIVNIHPALLPKYGGKGMYGARVHEAVVAAGEKESGITIHYINEKYDEGPAIFQAKCPVLPTDTAEDVAHKVHTLEYEYFPKVIEQLIQKK